MDRRVKERLVGAAILVAIVVLVVPELLPGSPRRAAAVAGHDVPIAEPRDPMRTVTLDIAQNSAGPALAPGRESAPQTATPASSASVASGPPPGARTAPAAAVVAPQVTPAPRAAVAPPAAAAPHVADAARALEKPRPPPIRVRTAAAQGHGTWAVQLGSFKDRANALKLARHWKSNGYPAYLSTVGGGARALHRVRIGPYRDRTAAARALAALEKRGVRAALVPPGR